MSRLSSLDGFTGAMPAGVAVTPGAAAVRAGLFDEQLKLAGLVAAPLPPDRASDEARRPAGQTARARPPEPRQEPPPAGPGDRKPEAPDRTPSAESAAPEGTSGDGPAGVTAHEDETGAPRDGETPSEDETPADAGQATPDTTGDARQEATAVDLDGPAAQVLDEASVAAAGAGGPEAPHGVEPVPTPLPGPTRLSDDPSFPKVGPEGTDAPIPPNLPLKPKEGAPPGQIAAVSIEGASETERDLAGPATAAAGLAGPKQSRSGPSDPDRRRGEGQAAGQKGPSASVRGPDKAPVDPPVATGAAPAVQTPNRAAQEIRPDAQAAVNLAAAVRAEGGGASQTGEAATSGQPGSGAPARAGADSAPQRAGGAGASSQEGEVDRVRFVQRVARAFQSLRDGGGSVRLRLHPPELGSLRVELTVRQGAMTARLEVENAAARSAILDNLPALRERLAQQDIRVERFDVDVGGGSSDGTPERPGDGSAWGRQAAQRNSPPRAREAAATAAPRAAPGPQGADGSLLNVIV